MLPVNNLSIHDKNSEILKKSDVILDFKSNDKVALISKQQIGNLPVNCMDQVDLSSLALLFKTNLKAISSQHEPITEQQRIKFKMSANKFIYLLGTDILRHLFFDDLDLNQRMLFLLFLSDENQKKIISFLRRDSKLQKEDLPNCLNTLSNFPLLYKSSMRLINALNMEFSVNPLDIESDTVVFPLTSSTPSCCNPFVRLLIAFNCSIPKLEILFKFNRLSVLEFVEGLTLFFKSNPSIVEVEGFIKDIFLSLSFKKYEEFIVECNKKSVSCFFYFITFINQEQLKKLLFVDGEELTKAVSFCLCDKHTETLLARACSVKSYFRLSLEEFYFQTENVDSSVINYSIYDLMQLFFDLNTLLNNENGETAIVSGYQRTLHSIPPLVIGFLFKIFPKSLSTFMPLARFFNLEQLRFMSKALPSSDLSEFEDKLDKLLNSLKNDQLEHVIGYLPSKPQIQFFRNKIIQLRKQRLEIPINADEFNEDLKQNPSEKGLDQLNTKFFELQAIFETPKNRIIIATQKVLQGSDNYAELLKQFNLQIMQETDHNYQVVVSRKREWINTLEAIENTVELNKGRKLNNDES